MFRFITQAFRKNLPAGNAAGLYQLARMEAEYYKQESDRMRCFEFWFRHMISAEVNLIEEQGKKPSRIVLKYSIGGSHDTVTYFNGIQIAHDQNAKELIAVECEDERKRFSLCKTSPQEDAAYSK